MGRNKYLLCAKATSTHGVSGTLRLENYTDSPKILKELKVMYKKEADGSYTPLNVEKASIQKEAVLAKFEEIDSVEDAIAYKGCEFYADRNDFNLSEGSVFISDIIGLDVIDAESGEKYGVVSDILTGRIQDIYVVSDINGGEFMIPSVPDFVKNTVPDGEISGVYVNLIEGMRNPPQSGGEKSQ